MLEDFPQPVPMKDVKMTSTTQRTLQAFVAILLLTIPSAALGTDWDQAEATKIATELADSVNEVYRSIVRKRTGAQVGSGQASSYLRLKDRLRVAKNESNHLATALKGGKGKDETIHAWRRLMTLVRDAREVGRRMFLEAPTQEKIAKANDLLEQLTPFYESESESAD